MKFILLNTLNQKFILSFIFFCKNYFKSIKIIFKDNLFFILALGGLWKTVTYTDPWVFQCLRGCDTLGRVDSKHFVDEVFGFRSYCVPLWWWELRKYKFIKSLKHRYILLNRKDTDILFFSVVNFNIHFLYKLNCIYIKINQFRHICISFSL